MRIAKQVSDPVHGVIPLTAVEVAVMNTQVFQRLRRVKQLGLAHYIFPSADHSRLAHSLGVCHITGQILTALRDSGVKISEDDWQLYRLAGLLHDVGHYPLSHCTEHAIKSYFEDKQSEALLVPSSDDESLLPPLLAKDKREVYKHERVSQLLTLSDKELSGVLRSNNINPEDVASIFLGQGKFELDKLISSDLDADRFDYLLRSSRATGLPYGSIDLPYLLTQLRMDSSRRVCIGPKGLRAADHFLLCRYFDYQQVVFHKSVVAMEEITQMVIGKLLELGKLQLSKADVRAAVENGEWLRWDDAYLMNLISDLFDDPLTDEYMRLKAQAIVERIPPKLVVGLDKVANRDDRSFINEMLLAKAAFDRKAQEIGIAREQYFEIERKFPLTSVGTSVRLGAELPDVDSVDKAIHILSPSGGQSVPIMQRPTSIMSVLSDFQQLTFSVYVLPKADQRGALDAVSKELMAELPQLSWV